MNKQLKKMMAKKMASYKRPHCHGHYTTKEGAKEWFKAKVDKKKLPKFPKEIRKDPKYAKYTIEQYEKKYPSW
jgi:hypothetical protein